MIIAIFTSEETVGRRFVKIPKRTYTLFTSGSYIMDTLSNDLIIRFLVF